MKFKLSPRTCEPCPHLVLDSALPKPGGTIPLPAKHSVQGTRFYMKQCLLEEVLSLIPFVLLLTKTSSLGVISYVL